VNNRDLGRRFKYQDAVARGRPAKRPRTLRCVWCKGKIAVSSRGRLPLYCSHSCRQRVYERGKWQQPHLAALRRDLARVEIRDAIRQEAWALLRQMGLTTGPKPPERPQRKRPDLRLVETDTRSAAPDDETEKEV
jgi:hypothetical protein